MSDIPTRKPVKEKTEQDAWEEFAAQYEEQTNPLKDMAKAADITPDIDSVLQDLDKDDSPSSLWDHPKLQGFFSFVETKIKQMQEHTVRIKDINNLTFFQLNQALANHFDVYMSLVSLYNIAEIEREATEQDFQTWWDELYVQKRSKVNAPSLSAQKWASSREIEAMVRVDNKEEYKERHIAVVAARRQMKFLQRLMEGWQDFKFALQTISKNVQTEYNNSGQEAQW